jgi:hypothetical protein
VVLLEDNYFCVQDVSPLTFAQKLFLKVKMGVLGLRPSTTGPPFPPSPSK